MNKKEAQPLKEVISNYLKALRIDGKMKQVSLLSNYEKIVGKTIAKGTRKIYFTGNTLIIELNSSVLRNELFMHRERLRALLNENAGEKLIKEIRLK
jgi:hypothetical protein